MMRWLFFNLNPVCKTVNSLVLIGRKQLSNGGDIL